MVHERVGIRRGIDRSGHLGIPVFPTRARHVRQFAARNRSRSPPPIPVLPRHDRDDERRAPQNSAQDRSRRPLADTRFPDTIVMMDGVPQNPARNRTKRPPGDTGAPRHNLASRVRHNPAQNRIDQAPGVTRSGDTGVPTQSRFARPPESGADRSRRPPGVTALPRHDRDDGRGAPRSGADRSDWPPGDTGARSWNHSRLEFRWHARGLPLRNQRFQLLPRRLALLAELPLGDPERPEVRLDQANERGIHAVG